MNYRARDNDDARLAEHTTRCVESRKERERDDSVNGGQPCAAAILSSLAREKRYHTIYAVLSSPRGRENVKVSELCS